jgi:WD40 repeat protein
VKQYFNLVSIGLCYITAILPLTTQTTIAQPIDPKPENVAPSSQHGIKFLRSLDPKDQIIASALSRDGKTLVTSSGGKLQVWNLVTGESKTLSLLDDKYATITSVAISPDLQTIVTGSSGLDINAEKTTPADCSSNSASGNFGFSCSLGGYSSQTIKSSSGGAIQVWNMSTGKHSGILEYSDSATEFPSILSSLSGIDLLSFSTDGNLLASTNRKEVKFWNVKTGKIISQLKTGLGWKQACNQSLAIDPSDSNQVFYTSHLTAYQLSTKKSISVSFPPEKQRDDLDISFLYGLETGICNAAFSADGKLIAVSSRGSIQIWQMTTTNRLHRFPTQLPKKFDLKEHYKYLAFSPDSQVLAAAKADGTIQLLDMKSGKEISRITAHSANCESKCSSQFLGFSPNGKMLVSIGNDGIIKLWKVE